LVDNRAAVQKKSEIMSYSKSNCWFGIYRVGDEQIIPDRMKVLSNNLDAKLAEKIAGKKVTVTRFEIFDNLQAKMKKPIAAMSFGKIKIVPSSQEIRAGGCDDAFALDQNPENISSVIVFIDVDVDGKIIKDKIVQLEPKVIGNEDGRGPTVRERIQKGVSKAIEEVVNRISI